MARRKANSPANVKEIIASMSHEYTKRSVFLSILICRIFFASVLIIVVHFLLGRFMVGLKITALGGIYI